MCANCVASGAAYAVPALAGLRLYARRVRRRRLRTGHAAEATTPLGSAEERSGVAAELIPDAGRPAGGRRRGVVTGTTAGVGPAS
jgi:hypothetical protein